MVGALLTAVLLKSDSPNDALRPPFLAYTYGTVSGMQLRVGDRAEHRLSPDFSRPARGL